MPEEWGNVRSKIRCDVGLGRSGQARGDEKLKSNDSDSQHRLILARSTDSLVSS